MKSVNGVNYYYLIYCIYQYEKALTELSKFNKTKSNVFFKGYITTQRVKRTVNGKIKYYTYKVFETVTYINGKRKRKRKNLSNEQINLYEKALNNKKSNRILFNKLKKNVIYWKTRLRRFERKGVFDFKLFFDFINKNKHQEQKNDNIITAKGDFVRSKNECIYANLSYMLNLPYYYEKELNLKIFDYDGREYHFESIHPGFTHIINNKPVYVEILGMMDDPKYSRKWEMRLKEYNANNIKLGKNLVCIHCRSKTGLNSRALTELIFMLKEGIIPKQIIYV